MTTRHDLKPVAESLYDRLVVRRVLCNTNDETEMLIRCTPRLLELLEESAGWLWAITDTLKHQLPETRGQVEDLLARIEGDLETK